MIVFSQVNFFKITDLKNPAWDLRTKNVKRDV